MTRATSIAQSGANNVTMRNRIINGAMMIDQRNAGASVTSATSNPYTLDRWKSYDNVGGKYTVQQNAGSVTPPTGYINYLGITSTSAYSPAASNNIFLMQFIEGLNVADLGWGSAGAATITVSFWVRSSLTGSFGGSIVNANWDMSYPFSYTINSANTWEQKTVTIAGPTSGTWAKDNTGGIKLAFGLGVGSNNLGTANAWTTSTPWKIQPTGSVNIVGTSGATLYITGVQLEAGTTATPFEQRLYGTELALCQRYYYQLDTTTGGTYTWALGVNSGADSLFVIQHPVSMRSSPTAGINGTFTIYNGSTSGTRTSFSSTNLGTLKGRLAFTQVGLAGNAVWSDFGTSLTFSAEL